MKLTRRTFTISATATVGVLGLGAMPVRAEAIKVAGIYTQPIQQKWDARLHQGLTAAQEAGEIEYVFSEKVANTDYIRVLREYCESGVRLIVGEDCGNSKEARKVDDDYPGITFLMGDPLLEKRNDDPFRSQRINIAVGKSRVLIQLQRFKLRQYEKSCQRSVPGSKSANGNVLDGRQWLAYPETTDTALYEGQLEATAGPPV